MVSVICLRHPEKYNFFRELSRNRSRLGMDGGREILSLRKRPCGAAGSLQARMVSRHRRRPARPPADHRPARDCSDSWCRSRLAATHLPPTGRPTRPALRRRVLHRSPDSGPTNHLRCAAIEAAGQIAWAHRCGDNVTLGIPSSPRAPSAPLPRDTAYGPILASFFVPQKKMIKATPSISKRSVALMRGKNGRKPPIPTVEASDVLQSVRLRRAWPRRRRRWRPRCVRHPPRRGRGRCRTCSRP